MPRASRCRRVRERVAGSHLVDEDPQDVHRRQEQVVERGEVLEEAASQGPEDLFERVGQLRHPAVADRRGRSLEGVRRAEDLGEGCFVRRVSLELQEAALDLFDLLDRLGDVDEVVARLEVEREVHDSLSVSPPAS